jgi:hypothetical protein
MHGFIARFAEGIFEPATVNILTAAFDDAWTRLWASNAPFAADDYAEAARTILARQIISLAKAGERDQRKLADGALEHLARQKVSRTPPGGRPNQA